MSESLGLTSHKSSCNCTGCGLEWTTRARPLPSVIRDSGGQLCVTWEGRPRVRRWRSANRAGGRRAMRDADAMPVAGRRR
jgi:hypothetical protein